MYTSFYKLKAKPFQISSDPDFMWLGEKHKEALATLKYGVLDNKGFLLLTGDVGTGKTTLINTLIQSLSDDIICTSVSDPSLSNIDFFNYIAFSFGMDEEFLSKGAFLVKFRKFLLDAHDNHKKVLLIIDESQLLTQELLEEIRLLSNIEKTNTKLINIFFVGQNEFNEILNREANRAVRQRLTLNYNIDPLTPDETDEYIKYRLKVAGAERSIFDPSAVQEVFMYSGGFPRRINVICDHALLSGYVKDIGIITSGIVKECAKELKIPVSMRNRDINGFSNHYQKSVPVVQPRPVMVKPQMPEERNEKGITHILIGIAGFSMFLVLCWWMLFPVSFQHFISKADPPVDFIKNIISGKISKPVPSSFPAEKADDSRQKDTLIEKSVSPSRDVKVDIVKQEIIQPENNHQGKKKIQLPEPLVQDELEETNENKPMHKVVAQSPDTSVVTAGSMEEAQNDASDSLDEMIKNIPLPKEKIIIRFKYNTNNFTEEGFRQLKEFADVLTNHPGLKFLVTGYTDSTGYQKYNIKLSEFRANIVGSFLLGRGAKPNQIEVKGLGSVHPVESNNTAWGRMMNRRVEIEIVK